MSATIIAFKPKDDPVYALIEAHRTAVAILNGASHISCNIDYADPGYKAAQDKSAEACEQLTAALCDLLACQPTTMVGLFALLDYVAQPQWLDGDEEGNTILSSGHTYGNPEGGLDEAKEFPRMIAAALRKMIEA